MFYDSTGKTYNKIKKIPHSNVGDLFGAALCTAKLHKTRDALLVGAPAFSENQSSSYDVGAVYVYTFGTHISVSIITCLTLF